MSSTHRTDGRPLLGVLVSPSLWATSAALVTLMALLLPLIYMGGVLDPRGNMKNLPVGLVSEDRGAPGVAEPLGTGIASSIRAADPSRPVAWELLDMPEARRRLASGRLYGILAVPAGFSADVKALADAAPSASRPRFDVLTNPGAGSLGSSLAGSAMQQAAHAASVRLGTSLLARDTPAAAHGSPARLLLSDPVEVAVSVGHPLGQRSGMGLSAFYYGLLLVLLGFLCAGIVSAGTDVALGYAPRELGPLRSHRPFVAISRRHAFLANSALTVALSLVSSFLLMAVTIGLLDMDAGHLPLLWAFSVFAISAVGVGAQALTSALGALGQPVGMLFFIALALPSSGGTIPIQAVPSAYRFLAEFEPMRQIMDGVRGILYFGARADAGLNRAWLVTGAGLVSAVVLGLVVTSLYDRRGLHRLSGPAEGAGASRARAAVRHPVS
ncbi:YhgE/Pip domain-containing protein [Streptomyces vinaceus]|uniref:YhgE/Pip domain-containing protein n=1 Tax=Streptomyces vinaceus TaxID=1960 RepID=UPI0036CE1AF2